MATSPVIEWRASTTPFAVLSSQAMTGTGYSGAIPLGTFSSSVTVRVYNNFLAASGVADALNCTLAVYDDTVHQGSAANACTSNQYVQVQVLDYNGVTTGQDSVWYGIGGLVKHSFAVNSATIGGATSNYITVSIQITIPTNAVQGAFSQGIWLEYNATA